MGRLYPTLPTVFPIEVTIKKGGNTAVHRFNKGDKFCCWYCGSGITLDDKTVFRFRHTYDGNSKVQCKICSTITDIVYFANKENRVSLKSWDSGLIKTEWEEQE